METPKTFKELFANSGIEPTTDESGNTHYNFKATLKEKQQQGYSEEEVIELLQKALTHKDDGETGSLVTAQGEIRPANFFSWFEKFKKK